MQSTLRRRRAGFSLIELVVTMTILAILVGIVSFRSGSVVEKSKVTKVLQLVDALKTACALHHADTGQYAYEYTNYTGTHRKLSADQTTTGWTGPYIDGPLSHNNSNPYGSLHLYNTPTAKSWINGFDVDGDGTTDVTTSANMLWLSGVDEASAVKIDDALDAGINGDWTFTGRVRWSSSSRYMWILIYR